MIVVRDPYAAQAERFLQHYATVRGVVRSVLVARQLDLHLPPPPRRVADIGGGAGHQALRMARDGYHVVLLDPSDAMLLVAREALAGEPADVRERVALVQGGAEDARMFLGEAAFDAVLCHGVAGQVEGPHPLVHALAAIARPGAVLSLLVKNARALAMRAALEGRFADALAAFDADRDTGGVGVRTRADTLEDLRPAMDEAGFDLVEWYGVRIFTDHWKDRTPGDDLAQVLAVEWEGGRRDPYRGVARLLHLIGRRRGL